MLDGELREGKSEGWREEGETAQHEEENSHIKRVCGRKRNAETKERREKWRNILKKDRNKERKIKKSQRKDK